MYRNGDFGLVFGRGEILLPYMIFVYHWTSWVSRTPQKITKGQHFFQRPQTMPQLHLLKFCSFFALCGPFWHKNSAHRSDLSLKVIKAKKANIRPNDSKLDFRIFKGLAMVPQDAKRSYKVPWSPVWIRFWETRTPEPKTGPEGQKISSDKKLLKVIKTH